MVVRKKPPSITPLRLDYKYPKLSKEDLPKSHKLHPLTFRKDEIENFHVLFFHRLLKKVYGEPSELEFQLSEKEEKEFVKTGKIKRPPDEWKYYIRTPSAGIIQIGTARKHSSFQLHYVLPEKTAKPSEKLIIDGKEFVNDFLREANRQKGNLLNPKKELAGPGEDIQWYLLDNIYLFNYKSAEFMLEYGADIEDKLQYEYLKYDPVEYDRDSKEMDHIEKFMLGLGMCYASAISYYFMAIEGFVNLVFHAFLKDELRLLDLEKRLDLALKLLLLPSLCRGFKNQHIDRESDIFKNFIRLRDFRNKFFHSKIEDSLKSICVFESGFFYICNLDENPKDFLPLNKMGLKKAHVVIVKSVVDRLIQKILDMMQEPVRKSTEKYILKKLSIPFVKDRNGNIRLEFKTSKGFT